MALAASALLHPALCADAPSGRAPRTPPWHNPCGRTTILPQRLRQPRHHQRQQQQQQQRQRQQRETAVPAPNASAILSGQSWSLRSVRDRLQIARDHLREEWKLINEIYKGVGQFGHVANFTWLPNDHLKWYRNEVACLDRNSQAAKVLPILHATLQNFSATLEELQKPRQAVKQKNEKERDLLMHRIGLQAKGVLCEVETALTDRALPRPLIENVVVNIHQRANSITDSLIEDWTVIWAYGNVLADWIPILRQLGLAKKLPRGETATVSPCGPYKPSRARKPNKRRGKNKGRNMGKDKPRLMLRPGQRRGRNRHRRRPHNRRRIFSSTTSSPLL